MLLALAAGWPAAAAAEGRALDQEAWRAFLARDFARAEAAARQAWSAAETDGDPARAGAGAANLAAALAARGRFADALQWSGRAEERLAAAGADRARGRLAAARAVMHYASGEPEAGEREFTRAAERLGPDDWPLAFVRVTVRVYADLKLDVAADALEPLRRAAEAAHDPIRTAMCLMAMGWVDTFGGGRAMDRFEKAGAVLRDSPDLELRAYAAQGLGVARMRAGELAGAEAAWREGLELARRRGDRGLQIALLNDLSLLQARRDQADAARASDLEAERLLDGIAEDLRTGAVEDTVMLDFRQLSKFGYLNLPPVLYPHFRGIFDQLALDPALARDGPR
jgi:tetratricopeptide (TPR) repeat protein